MHASVTVSALQVQLLHALQRQLPKVPVVHPGGDERHGDVSLDAVHTGPWGHQG